MTQILGSDAAPTLSAADLKTFSRERIALIREMESYGWRGRRTAKQHVLMFSPDGETSCGISRRETFSTDSHNAARVFRRWLRQQQEAMVYPAADAISVMVAFTANHDLMPQAPARPAITQPPKRSEATTETVIEAAETVEVAPVDTAPEPEPEPVLPVAQQATSTRVTCDVEDCTRDFQSLQYLNVHKVRAHAREACPICDRQMAPGNLPRHRRKHAEVMGTHEQVMREALRLREENARLRTEAAEWQSMAEATEAELADLTCGLRTLIGG